MSKNRRIRETSVSARDGGSTGRRREVLGVVGLGAAILLLIALVGVIGLVVAAVVATPLRMRDVLRAIGSTARVAGGALVAAVRSVVRFWGEVLGAMFPARDHDDDDDVLEVDDRDVLEVGDD